MFCLFDPTRLVYTCLHDACLLQFSQLQPAAVQQDTEPMVCHATSPRPRSRRSLKNWNRKDLRWYTHAISEQSARSRWREGILLWYKLPDSGLEPNTFTFNAAMAACRQGSLWQKSVDLSWEATTKGVRTDTISLNTCLSALPKGKGFSFFWRLALCLLRMSRWETLQLDAFTCTAVLTASKGKWWRARSFLEAQQQQQIPIAGNLQLRNAYISAALNDDWDLALQLLHEPNAPQDAITFKAISGPFSRSIAWETCMGLLEDAQLRRLRRTGPTPTTPTFVMSAFGRAELWQKAILGTSRGAEAAAITAAASACQRALHWESALAMSRVFIDYQGELCMKDCKETNMFKGFF